MKRAITILLLAVLFSTNLYSQQIQEVNRSYYDWDWTRDGIWTGLGIAGSAVGLMLIQNKEGLTEAELAMVVAKQDDINFIDKWAVGNNSDSANNFSDIPFAFSFATPLLLLFDDEVNEQTATVLGLYLESLATTGAMYTLTAGLVSRSRPYVYSDEESLERRTSGNGQRSFYSGHVAAAATATFFTAKVYTDLNPDLKGKFFVWTGAALVPATIAYFRLEAGQHFLTDMMLGYALGAATGYLVPELHRTKVEGVSIRPAAGITRLGDEYKGLSLNYTF